MGSIGKTNNSSNPTTVSALHFTSEANVKSILSNDFDLERTGQGAGLTWGKGVYFSTEQLEQNFYSNRLNTKTAIQADIDTSKMFTADLGTGPVKNWDSMYKTVVKQLPKSIQKEYRDYVKSHKDEKIYSVIQKIISNHYTGLIIKQNQPNGLDPISGGNQIVVYDKSVIKNKRRRKK